MTVKQIVDEAKVGNIVKLTEAFEAVILEKIETFISVKKDEILEGYADKEEVTDEEESDKE